MDNSLYNHDIYQNTEKKKEFMKQILFQFLVKWLINMVTYIIQS